MSAGKLPCRGDLLNLRSEMAKRRRFIRCGWPRAGDLLTMKNECPAEVNFEPVHVQSKRPEEVS